MRIGYFLTEKGETQIKMEISEVKVKKHGSNVIVLKFSCISIFKSKNGHF